MDKCDSVKQFHRLDEHHRLDDCDCVDQRNRLGRLAGLRITNPSRSSYNLGEFHAYNSVERIEQSA